MWVGFTSRLINLTGATPGIHLPCLLFFYAKRDNILRSHSDRPIDRIPGDFGRVAEMGRTNRTAPYQTGRFVLLTRVEQCDHPGLPIHTGPQRERNEPFIADP